MAIIYGEDKKPDEFGVLEKLSQLSDDYHVFCDLNITILDYVKYNKKKDLGTAQMDYVIISKKGIVLIQAKDWSAIFDNQEVNPHEQTDRAGKVLWLTLKPLYNTENLHVTSVLLSTHQNIKYDPKYKHVLVSDLKKINRVFRNKGEIFSERDVKRMVEKIKD
jgi:hypothetical protein